MTMASDLAMLGEHDRAELPVLHEVLRALPERSAVDPRDLVQLAADYVERRAAVAWATTISISVAVVLAYCNVPLSELRESVRMSFLFPEQFRGWPAAAIVLALASIAARFARRRAERRFASAMTSPAAPLETARRLVAHREASSVVLGIASVTGFVTYFAVQLGFANGEILTCPQLMEPMLVDGHFEYWWIRWYTGDGSYWNFADRIRDLTIVLSAVALLAIGVGWAYRSRRSLLGILRSRIVGIIATIASLGLLYTMWRNAASWPAPWQPVWSGAARTELTVALALSVFVAVTSRALRSAR
jgi:hypothetical protein